MSTQITKEIVLEIIEHHWPGYVGNIEEDSDGFKVILAPLATQSGTDDRIEDEPPTSTSNVSWKDAIVKLADRFPPYTPLNDANGRFQFYFDR